MTADDHARLQLLRRLEEVLGREEAETLVTHLPPQPWDELATKADIRSLEARFDGVNGRFDGINGRFDGINERFDGLNERFDGLNERFDGVSHRFDAIDYRFDAVNSDSASLGHRIDALRVELLGALDQAFRKQTWALLGTMIALVALVLAGVQLVR